MKLLIIVALLSAALIGRAGAQGRSTVTLQDPNAEVDIEIKTGRVWNELTVPPPGLGLQVVEEGRDPGSTNSVYCDVPAGLAEWKECAPSACTSFTEQSGDFVFVNCTPQEIERQRQIMRALAPVRGADLARIEAKLDELLKLMYEQASQGRGILLPAPPRGGK